MSPQAQNAMEHTRTNGSKKTSICYSPLLLCICFSLDQTDYSKAVESRQRLDSQLQENKIVQEVKEQNLYASIKRNWTIV